MYQVLAEETIRPLASVGVGAVFGVPGGGANLAMIAAAEVEGVPFVLAHGETAAAIMASTYGLLSGAPGVCIVTRGPGLLSAANGVAQATLDRHPLILISDTVPGAERGRIGHQLVDQRGVMAPVAKWSATISPSNATETLATAIKVASTQPFGAVHLDFDPTWTGDNPAPSSESFPPPAREEIARARRLMANGSRPIAILGAEAVPAAESVVSLLESHRIPFLTTYHAKGIAPESSDLFCGLFTNGRLEQPLIDESDLILALGVDPVEPYPGPWTASAPVLAINPWPIEQPYYPLDNLLTGPIDALLGEVLPAETRAWTWRRGIGSDHRERISGLLKSGDPTSLSPQSVIEAVRVAMGDETTITVDAGAHFLVAMPLLEARRPRQVLISNGLATMGFALPAAIGVALARPEDRVVCVTGDGGLAMVLGELETVSRLGLNIVVLVLNDAALTMIRLKQGPGQGGPGAVEYQMTDFAAIAEASGMPGVVVEHPSGLAEAVGRRGPLLVDARIDPGSYAEVMKVSRR